MIIIKKYRELYVPQPIVAPCQIAGEIRLVLRDGESMNVVHDTGWSPNLVTDYGLTRVGSNNWYAYHHIGDGATAPDVLDTTLDSYLSSSNVTTSNVTTTQVPPNYEFSKTIAKRFAAGDGTGTIRELGVGPNTGDTNMVIRTLVSPAVVKGPTQVLDTYHKFTVYPDVGADILGTVSIAGDTYDTVNRAADVDFNNPNAIAAFAPLSAGWQDAFDGDLGTILGLPSGSSDASALMTITGSGAGYHDYEVLFGLDDGVFGGGIRSLVSTPAFGFTGGRQIRFGKQGGGDETIPKTDHDELLFTLKMIWGRYP